MFTVWQKYLTTNNFFKMRQCYRVTFKPYPLRCFRLHWLPQSIHELVLEKNWHNLFIAKYSKASRELYIFNNCFGQSQVFLILNAIVLRLICKEEISSWSLEGSKMGWKRFTYLLTTAWREVCSVLITQPENLNWSKNFEYLFSW